VTVHDGKVRKAARTRSDNGADYFSNLPAPTIPDLAEPCQILVTGIGGTGVITVGALMGMAAHIEGKGCTVLDFTGLAQKNGAVMSHIRLSRSPDDLHAVRIAAGETDVLIACDMLVAASPAALSRMDRLGTRAVVNDHVQPTAEFVRNTQLDFQSAGVLRSIRAAVSDQAHFVDATGIATALMGDSIATNLFMLGFAWQKGLVPLSLSALEQAIELNGVAVEANKRTFAWGRLAAHDPAAVETIARPSMRGGPAPVLSLSDLVARRKEDLEAYQDAAYAERYSRAVEEAAQAEARLGGASGYAEAVARNLYKLMAYKDEYEVARLYSDGAFKRQLQAQFEDGYKLEFHLAAPVLARRDPRTGEPRKQAYGGWMLGAFGLLAHGKRLRGGWADPFGYSEERRAERRLISDYETLTRRVGQALNPANHAEAIALAEWPQLIRGYGHVKLRGLAAANEKLAALVRAFEAAGAASEEAA
jgi:indolepyruvate ferredoxin oxidoreductase